MNKSSSLLLQLYLHLLQFFDNKQIFIFHQKKKKTKDKRQNFQKKKKNQFFLNLCQKKKKKERNGKMVDTYFATRI